MRGCLVLGLLVVEHTLNLAAALFIEADVKTDIHRFVLDIHNIPVALAVRNKGCTAVVDVVLGLPVAPNLFGTRGCPSESSHRGTYC